MLSPAILITLMLALSLGGSIILLLMGRRLGEPLAGYVGTGISILTFGCSVMGLVSWIYAASSYGYQVGPLVETIPWLPIGSYDGQRTSGFLDLAIYVDSLSIALVTTVAFVSATVHLFSLGYMRSDTRYPQFFCYLSLFSFSMIGLLISGTLLQLLIFWELVGFCSYMLIGFWREKPEASAAAIKAFLINRIGDVGFIVGMGLLVARLGNVTLPDLWMTLSGDTHLSVMSTTMLTVIGILLFCGAIGKSAQFPLQTWLPDAMAGPTPVSALIHAATMVAAGVFLLARIYPILTPDARLFIVIIALTTITIGTLCALAQKDIKRALAYSTIAQLGLMVLAIGVGSFTGAMFHLMTHAFFKALLFLCAGQVIYAMHHDNQLDHYGGLFRRLPVTAVTFAVAALAMSGAPYTSGIFSKEMILGHLSAWSMSARETGHSIFYSLAFWIPVVGVYLTPVYLARIWMLTFTGRPRKRSLYKHSRELGIMSFPLVLLTGMTLVCGYSWFPIQSLIDSTLKETRNYYAMSRPGGYQLPDPFATVWPTLNPPIELGVDSTELVDVIENITTPEEAMVEKGNHQAHFYTGWAWLAGLIVGVAIYLRGFSLTDRLMGIWPLNMIRKWLANGMYFDVLQEQVFLGVVQMLVWIAVMIDRFIIDPLIDTLAWFSVKLGRGIAITDDAVIDGAVRGTYKSVWLTGGAVRLTQGGRVRVYVASAIVLIFIGIGAALLTVMNMK